MRRLFALAMVALIALSLSIALLGCGGGSQEPAATTPATETAPPAETMSSDSAAADTAMAPH